MSDLIKVLIVDDEDLIRHGMKLVIESEDDMEVVGTAKNGLEAVQMAKLLQPNLILMDIQMPVMNGIESIKRIKTEDPNVIILILTTFNEEEYIVEGLAVGAGGYLLKGIDFDKLIRTIRNAMKGEYYLPSAVTAKLVNYIYQKEMNFNKNVLPTLISNHSFTNREQEIIRLLLKRLSNREIANHLYVSEGTIKNNLTIIYDKLEVKSRYDAIQCLEQKAK